MKAARVPLPWTASRSAARFIRRRIAGIVIHSFGVALVAASLGQAQAMAAGRAVVYAASPYAPVATILARAERGDVAAAAWLGHLYETGKGVPQDYYEAAKWYYRAATRGHGGAQYALAMLYNKGRGVKQDYVLSYMWLNLSAAQAVGADRAFKVNMRDSIASKMTPPQLQAAQELALDWTKAH
jgi:TPR repeat protein